MKEILIRYFHARLPNLPYEGNEQYPYSEEKRNEITNVILNAGYNVLLQRLSDENLIIWIDKHRFQQR